MDRLYRILNLFKEVLTDSMHLSVAQVTVLATVMLVAHALPIEVKIAQAAGTRFLFQGLVRVVGAFTMGWGLHHVYAFTIKNARKIYFSLVC